MLNSAYFRLTIVIVFAIKMVLISPYIGLDNSLSSSLRTELIEQLRWPRVLLAFIVGMGLAACGLVFQSLFQNVLATPFTLGVSSGAALGAAIAVLFGIDFVIFGFTSTSLLAFIGAAITIFFVYGISHFRRSNGTLLLSGIAISFFFSSLIMVIQFLIDIPDAYRLLRWLMGNLSVVGYSPIWQLLPIVLFTVLMVFYFSRELNLMSLGDAFAQSRGVAIKPVRLILFITTSLCVGALVSICGPIGFIGMMVPHICRLLVSHDHRLLVPASCFFGGGFLVFCDLLARSAFSPVEFPVGIVTTLLGGPFFLWLLIRRKRPLL